MKIKRHRITLQLLLSFSLIASTLISAPSRVIAIGDIHADPQALISILFSQHLIEKTNKGWSWVGNDTQVVFMGDMVDRGPNSKKVLEWILKFKAQAQKSGGNIHTLIGNHELMLLNGDKRYLSEKDTKILKELRNPDSPIGKLIQESPALLLLGKSLFVHAGVDNYLLQDPTLDRIRQINEEIQEWVMKKQLSIQQKKRSPKLSAELRVLFGANGPFWTRKMAEGKLNKKNEIDPILKGLEIQRIVSGHTVDEKNPNIRSLYDDTVYVIDSGNSEFYEGNLSAFEMEKNGKVTLHHQGEIKRLLFSDKCTQILEKI